MGTLGKLNSHGDRDRIDAQFRLKPRDLVFFHPRARSASSSQNIIGATQHSRMETVSNTKFSIRDGMSGERSVLNMLATVLGSMEPNSREL